MSNFSLASKLHPPKLRDFTKWSMWYREVVGFASDAGLKRIPRTVYRELFNDGLLPRDAVQRLVDKGWKNS